MTMGLYWRAALLLVLIVGVAACGVGASLPGGKPPTSSNPRVGSLVYADGDRLLVLNPDAGGPPRELYHGRGKGTVLDPAVSPDGRQVAFTYTPVPAPTASFGSDIHVIGIDGSNPRPVFIHDVDGGLARAPAWSPDGTALYFSYSFSRKPPGQTQLVAVQQLERLDLATGRRAIVATDADSPAVSSDRGQVVFIRVPPDGVPARPAGGGPGAIVSLWLADSDGGNPRPLVNDPAFTLIWSARFAPDGRRLVFTAASSQRSAPRLTTTLPRPTGLRWPAPVAAHGFPLDLWLVDIDSGKVELLAALAADDLIAAWSPDGTHLALQAADGLFTLDLATGAVTLVTPTAGFGAIDWTA